MSELALTQCVTELRAACRRPIDEHALTALVDQLRPGFEEILDHPDGAMRWADHGGRMRDNGRHLGALADFIGHQGDITVIGVSELALAFDLVRAACTVGADRN
jgi:hypothetical protein